MYTNDMMTLFIGIHLTMHYGTIFRLDIKGNQTMDSNDLGFLKCYMAINISLVFSQTAENKRGVMICRE